MWRLLKCCESAAGVHSYDTRSLPFHLKKYEEPAFSSKKIRGAGRCVAPHCEEDHLIPTPRCDLDRRTTADPVDPAGSGSFAVAVEKSVASNLNRLFFYRAVNIHPNIMYYSIIEKILSTVLYYSTDSDLDRPRRINPQYYSYTTKLRASKSIRQKKKV
jgi:hypothetical protein